LHPVYFLCQADVVNESKRAAVFSWISGLLSASHVLGDLLARFLPEKYIFAVCLCCQCSDHSQIFHTCLFGMNLIYSSTFQVSIVLLIICPVYMKFFLVESMILAPKNDRESGCWAKIVNVPQQRFKSMRRAAEIVIFRFPFFLDDKHYFFIVTFNYV